MNRETGGRGLSDIEAGLERLMPQGLSDGAREDLEMTVDRLASGVCLVPVWRRPVVLLLPAVVLGALVLAAVALGEALGALGAGSPHQLRSSSPAHSRVVASHFGSAEESSGIAVLAQISWIEGGVDLGVQSLSDSGDVSRGWSYTGVEEERVLHELSGYEVVLQREFEAELYAESNL